MTMIIISPISVHPASLASQAFHETLSSVAADTGLTLTSTPRNPPMTPLALRRSSAAEYGLLTRLGDNETIQLRSKPVVVAW